MSQARRRGYEAIDLDVRFREDFARNGRRFEPPTDGHWNGEGHRVLAEAVEDTEAYRKTFAPQSPARDP
jgi:hypothetical protein